MVRPNRQHSLYPLPPLPPLYPPSPFPSPFLLLSLPLSSSFLFFYIFLYTGSFTYAALTSDTYWQFSVDDIAVRETSLGFCGTTGCTAIAGMNKTKQNKRRRERGRERGRGRRRERERGSKVTVLHQTPEQASSLDPPNRSRHLICMSIAHLLRPLSTILIPSFLF